MLARRARADQVLDAGFDTESGRMVVAARRPVTVLVDSVAGRERVVRSDLVRTPAVAGSRGGTLRSLWRSLWYIYVSTGTADDSMRSIRPGRHPLECRTSLEHDAAYALTCSSMSHRRNTL